MPPVSQPAAPEGPELLPDDIVISGISGQLPRCANLDEFRKSLFNKEELLTKSTECWNVEHPELPLTIGAVNEWRKFDVDFFGLTHEEAKHHMDPSWARLLEDSYEAIFDAGMNPDSIRGQNIAVIIAATFAEAEGMLTSKSLQRTNADKIAQRIPSGRYMMSSLVSSSLGVTGPTYTLDTACSSNLYALSKAFDAMKHGECDGAIVAGVNYLHGYLATIQFKRLGVLTNTAHCRPLDSEGDGYVRAEAAGVFILQRARDAKRAYAVVMHAEINADGLKGQNITNPSRQAQAKLLRSVYSKPEFDAKALTYMEIHGTGTTAGDPVEMGAVEDVLFNEGRRSAPLLIGSVKSNLGHSEASSGFCSLAKVLIMMQTGYIPPTIHFNNPRKEISSLHNGRLQVVTDPIPWQPGPVAINNFGFGGANAHIVLRPGPQRRTKSASWDSVPRLVVASGRTEEAALALVQLAAAGGEGAVVDVELVRLLHELSATPTPGHPYRAFGLAPSPAKYAPVARRCGDARPPLWLVLAERGACSGDWAAVGAALLRLPAFAAALRRRDAPLSDAVSDAGIVQEAVLDVLWAVGVRAEETTSVDAIGAITIPEEAVVLLVLPAGEATRAVRAALGSRCEAERVVALFGEAKHSNLLLDFLCGIGRLYCLGAHVEVAGMYADVPFPVSCETPMISPHVMWDHSKVLLPKRQGPRESTYSLLRCVSLHNPEHEYMAGHVIDDRLLVPATGYIFLVWEMFASGSDRSIENFPVVFENVRFQRATHLPKDYGHVMLLVRVHRESGAFEVSEGLTAVVTGIVRPMTDQDRSQMLPPAEPWDPSGDAASPHMTPRDVYKALRLRGYNYSGLFRGIAAASCDGRRGLLRWDDNWATFLDCMMQLQLLPDASGTLAVPTFIQRLSIDAASHTPHLHEYGTDQVVAVASVDAVTRSVRAGGAELRGLRANVIARRKPEGDPVLERYDFAPYRLDEGEEAAEDGEEAWAEAVRVCAQIALENRGPVVRGASPLATLEILTKTAKRPLAPLLLSALGDMPLVQASLKLFLENGLNEEVKEMAKEAIGKVAADATAFAAEKDVTFVLGCGLVASTWLERSVRVLAPGGCIMSLEDIEENTSAENDEERVRAAGLRLVLRWRRGRHALLLLRKGGWEVDACNATVVHVREEAEDGAGEAFGWLPTLQAALREAQRPEQRVLLVAEGQPLSGVQGLFNCLHQEPGTGRDILRLYVLEKNSQPFSLESDVYRKQLEMDLAVNELRGGLWGSPRHFLFPNEKEIRGKRESYDSEANHAFCDAATIGDLSSFAWYEGDLDVSGIVKNPREELVHVYYSALNFKDVMLASGKLNAGNALVSPGQRSLLGFEVAGRTSDGRRLMGISTKCAGIATLVSIGKNFLWDVPDDWSLEQAATVPAVYSTAVYALMIRGRMRRGESVLVHAGSGGVGQAAIHLALAQGCRVLATAGTDEKRRFLLRTFPQLAPEDVGNSRDASFEALVLRRTAGRGVDLVLNSLAGDKLLASLRCLAPAGRFLEIGKFDMEQNTNLKLEKLSHGRTFHGILLDKFWMQSSVQQQTDLAVQFSNLLKEGAIKPLPAVVFERDSVEKAFRYMAGGKHIGKVLIRIREEEQRRVTLPSPLRVNVKRRFYCLPNQSYIICGGLGGFGLELADWLVSRGCKNLVLTSRRGVSNGYQARKMLLWERKGVRVHVFTGDAATHAGADTLLRAANALAPLAAIFNLAVVLRDALFDNQTADAFVESYRCKALATRRLDAASRRLCPRLTHFVVFSSVSCGRGNAGQTNYGLANSVMEGVVRARREAGLPGTAVQWGAVGDVGLVADMRDDDRQLEIGGTLQQRLSSCLEVLDDFLVSGHSKNDRGTVFSSMVVAEKKSGANDGDLLSLVAGIFGIKDISTVSPELTLAELGLDSMMAVELQQALEREFNTSLSLQDLRALTFSGLRNLQSDLKKKNEGAQQENNDVRLEKKAEILHVDMILHLARELSPPEGPVSLVQLSKGEGTALLLLPGIEDDPSVLVPLASQIGHPSWCIYTGALCDRVSLLQLTDIFMPIVKQYLSMTPTFQIVGYSFGGLLALEIATRLEKEGLQGSLLLLDSSHDLLKDACLQGLNVEADELPKLPEFMLENMMLTPILAQLEGLSEEDASKLLEASGEWTQRLQRAVKMAEMNEISVRTLSMMAEKAVARVCIMCSDSWPSDRPRLSSAVTLVRPTRSFYSVHDYGLSKICNSPVHVHCIDGVDHMTILTSPRTAEIIKEVFSDK